MPRNASPGVNDIHLVYLSDLVEIIRANSHLFNPIVPTTNHWIALLEAIRIPRNLVGHMNFPNAHDRNAIENAYNQLPLLLRDLTVFPIPIKVPK